MFAVFGKSYEAAKKKALKPTPTHTGTGASYRKLTDAEYKITSRWLPYVPGNDYSNPALNG